MMEGGDGEITVPVPAYLIEHPKGSLLFDTGMHPDCQRDLASRVPKAFADAFRFHLLSRTVIDGFTAFHGPAL